MTSKYIILAESQHSIFIFRYFNVKLLVKYSQTPVLRLCDSCQILVIINFQNNLTWPNSNTAPISLHSRLKYSKITHRYAKKTLHSLGSLLITSNCQFHQSWGINARKCFLGPVAPQQGMLGTLIVWWPALFSLQWQWQRVLCMVAVLQSSQLNPQRNKKMESICYKTN